MVKRKSLPKHNSSFTGPAHASEEKPVDKKKAKIYTKALKEIRHLQKTAHLLIPRAPFLRLIRELIMHIGGDNYRITAMAVEALREAAEHYVVCTMEDAYQLAVHAKRVTLFPRDIELVVQLRRDFAI